MPEVNQAEILPLRITPRILRQAFLSAALLVGSGLAAEAATTTRRTVSREPLPPPTMIAGYREIRQGQFYAQVNPVTGEILYATQGNPGMPGSVSFTPRLDQKILIYSGATDLSRRNLQLLQEKLISLRGAAAPRLQGLPTRQEPAVIQLVAATRTVEPSGRSAVLPPPPPAAPAPEALSRGPASQSALVLKPSPGTTSSELAAEVVPVQTEPAPPRPVLAPTGAQRELEAARAAARDEATRSLAPRIEEARREQSLNDLTEQRAILQHYRRLAAQGAEIPEGGPDIAQPLRDGYMLGLRSDAARLAGERTGGRNFGFVLGAAGATTVIALAGWIMLRRRRSATQRQIVEQTAMLKQRLRKMLRKTHQRHNRRKFAIIDAIEREKIDLLLRPPIILANDAQYPHDPNLDQPVPESAVEATVRFIEKQGFGHTLAVMSPDQRRIVISLSPVSFMTLSKDSVSIHGQRSDDILTLAMGLGLNQIENFKPAWEALAVQQVNQPATQRLAPGAARERDPSDSFRIQRICALHDLSFGTEGLVRPRGIKGIDRPTIFAATRSPEQAHGEAEAPTPA